MYQKLSYIIKVSFELGGAEDRQSVAESICFSEDLVVKRNFSCGTQRQKKKRSQNTKTVRENDAVTAKVKLIIKVRCYWEAALHG